MLLKQLQKEVKYTTTYDPSLTFITIPPNCTQNQSLKNLLVHGHKHESFIASY